MPTDPTAGLWSDRRHRWWALAITAVAFVARVVPAWRGGGLSATNGYDDGVYYAAATSFVHGRLPYRDYVLLHPPGSTLLLAPFATLARLSSDTAGFETARVAFMLLGAVNTWLVMVVALRVGRRAALFAGVFYALFFPAIYVARTISLEELGTTSVLVALALLVRPVARAWTPSNVALVLAGVALGVGTTVKIWGAAPLVIIVVWQAFVGGRAAVARIIAGAVGAAVVICLPFFVAAPATMFRYIISDQVGRPSSGGSVWSRLRDITGIRPLVSSWPPALAYALLAVAVGLGLVATVVALRGTQTRVFSALLLGLALVLLVSPSFFDHYAAFTAAPAALVVAVAADEAATLVTRRSLPTRGRIALLTALGVAVVALALPGVLRPQGIRVPRALAAAAAGVPGCVTADDPTVLILMNAQSRDLRRHCTVWVDVTGITYDTGNGRRPDNGRRQREADQRWQRDVRAYLLSGTATIVTRSDTDLDPANVDTIHGLRPILRSGSFVLRAVRSP